MPEAALATAAAESLLGRDLLVPLGGVAGILTLLGLVLLLPLHLNQRREIARLERWREREPEAGTRDFPALLPGPSAPGAPRTAAERVTSERPALERIGTAESAALAPPRRSILTRALERGPRHPLIISLAGLALAAAIIFGVGQLLEAGDREPLDGNAARRAAVDVVVLNASSSTGLAGDFADYVDGAGFTVTGTSVAAESAPQSVVRYAPGAKRKGKLLARVADIPVLQPFDRQAEAAADGADVVVIAGEDARRAIQAAKRDRGRRDRGS